jgi:glycosyltransferase involved in cell wall biosynthesis
MKIAYLGIKGLPSKAGADRVVEAIVTRLDKEQHQITVYCSTRVVPPGTQVPGMRLIRIPVLGGKHSHAFSLFFLSAFHALFWGDYDLVHVHNAEAGVTNPILRLRFKVLGTSHGLGYGVDKWGKIAKFFLRMADFPFIYLSNRVTSVSLPVAHYYQEEYNRQVVYLPNGVDLAPAVNSEAARARLDALGVAGKPYILFAAGRIIPLKGCHLLLEAWRQLDLDYRLIVIGDFEQLPAYSQQLRELADPRVIFIPFIASRDELYGLIQGAELFVLPSTVEAMSMMLLEVVSLGTPILCSDIPGNTSVLCGEHALFFRSGDVQDLARQLKTACENPEQMKLQAAEGRAWVSEQFSWDTLVARYDALYREL